MSGTSEAARLAAVMVPWASEATRIAEKTIGPPLDLFDPTSQHQIDLAYYLMVLGLIALYGRARSRLTASSSGRCCGASPSSTACARSHTKARRVSSSSAWLWRRRHGEGAP